MKLIPASWISGPICYRLDGRDAVPCHFDEWTLADIVHRLVARDELPGGIVVSTVFLGIDHGHGAGPPLLFETMVFGLPDDDDHLTRCTTWAQAEGQHARILETVLERL